MLKRFLNSRAGHTLTEVTIASSMFVTLLAFGIPVFKTIGDAGDEGGAQLSAQVENQAALLRMASELQNASTTAVDDLGAARLAITVGLAPDPLVNPVGDNNLGGFRGTLGTSSGSGVVGSGATGNDTAVEGTTPGSGTHGTTEELQSGIGGAARGGSHFGRERLDVQTGATVTGSVAQRPRHASIATNSILRFQKVDDFTIDGTGTAVITWGPQIRYQVNAQHQLTRTESGTTVVVARHVVGFQAQLSDAGTVLLTLVTQKQASATGRVKYQANQIEISPKND